MYQRSLNNSPLGKGSLVLIIAEKNIVARRIAHILSSGSYSTKKVHGIPVYFFTLNGENYACIGLKGHVIDYDFPRRYRKWILTDLEEVIWSPLVVVAKEAKYIEALKALAPRVKRIIVATDYDREGELIGLEAVHIVKKASGRPLEVKRMKFSAVTREEILSAFRNLTDINQGLADAADARRAIDLIWGATLTRFFTLASRARDVYSIGRVQTPTLALIVHREREIEAFVPQKYWVVVALLEGGLKATHVREKFNTLKDAQKVKSRSKGPYAEVIDVNKSLTKRKPPHPMDTTTLLALSASIGFSVDKAMKIAEDLYRFGYISYPRTDNTVYPESLDLIDILRKVCKGSYEKFLELILSQKRITPTRGPKRSKDHPPIHPVSYLPPGKLSRDHEALYDLITRYFLATLSPPSTWERVVVRLKVGEEEYLLKGKRLIDAGWERILKPIEEEEAEEEIITFEVRRGDRIRVKEIKVLERKTRPPRRYTQASLVKEMEKLGLGTKSTRHEIIKKLFSRKYVEGKYIKPTNLGKAVIELIERFVPIIGSPELTRKIEKEMDKIEIGEKRKDEVIMEARRILKGIFENLMKNVSLVGDSIRESKRKDLESSKKVGICPKCGAPLIITRSKRGKRFIMCMNYPKCRTTYPLPQKGRIYVLREMCADGKVHKIKIVWREGGVKKEWILCPSDYSQEKEK